MGTNIYLYAMTQTGGVSSFPVAARLAMWNKHSPAPMDLLCPFQ